MTAGKQQVPSPSGMTSEVEVLRALKLLFEHHQALDEKTKDKNRQLLECLELTEQKLQQTLRKAEMLRSLAAELVQMEAVLSKAGERLSDDEERLRQMEAQLEEKHSELRRVQTLKEQDWELLQQASVQASVAQALESDEDVSDGGGDRVTFFSSAAQLSPSEQADSKTFVEMLQEQVDAINEEIRWIQEEKENMEQRAQETENRAGMGRLGNLPLFKSLSSLSLCPSSSPASSSLPSSGRSKPRRRRHSLLQDIERLGFKTVLPTIWEEGLDDETTITYDITSPASPRSVRLNRQLWVLRLANHEVLRNACKSTGSQDNPGDHPSSSTSSQDLLQKPPKISKSSICRFFGKKEKGRP